MGRTSLVPFKNSEGQVLKNKIMPTLISKHQTKSSNGFLKFICLMLFLD